MENGNVNLKLENAIKNSSNFQTFLNKFVVYLTENFQDYLAENIKSIIDKMKIIMDEDMTKYKAQQQLKKSPTFVFITKFVYTIKITNSAELIHNQNSEELYKNIDFTMDLLEEIHINLYPIIYKASPSNEQKEKITQFIRLLFKIGEDALKVYELSDKDKKKQKDKKIIVNHFREKMRKIIYIELGDEINNESMHVIIEEILDEIEKKRKTIETGQMKPEQIKHMITKLYAKFEQKHKEGKIKEQELFTSTKGIIKKVLDNKDLNINNEFKTMLSGMNFDKFNESEIENIMKDITQLSDTATTEDFENLVKKYNINSTK